MTRFSSLEVAVAASPPKRIDISLAHESRLVKSALVYADRVNLASLATGLHAYYESMRHEDLAKMVLVVRQVLGLLEPESVDDRRFLVPLLAQFDEFLALQPESNLTHSEVARRSELEREIAPRMQVVREQMFDPVVEARSRDLNLAVDEGLLHIVNLGAEAAMAGGQLATEDITTNYLEYVGGCLDPGKNTLPLFDVRSSELAQELTRLGLITPAVVRDAREAAVAAALVGDLPGFHDMPMDAVLTIRDITSDCRTAFRAAVAAASRELPEPPWEPGFARDLDHVYRAYVDPAQRQIAAAFEDRKVTGILKRFAAAPGVLPAAVSVGVTAGFDFIMAAAGALLGTAVINALTRELRYQADSRKSAAENGFFLLYQARSAIEREVSSGRS